MYARCIGTAVLLVGLLAGCGSSSAHQDPWYRAPPAEGDRYWTWPKLDKARLHEVVEVRQGEAQALLQDAALIELTVDQAAEYIGRPLPDAPGTVPYLVRSLIRNPGMGQYVVYTGGVRIVVQHGSLGSDRSPLGRRALVLQLERKPAEVYVYVKTAE